MLKINAKSDVLICRDVLLIITKDTEVSRLLLGTLGLIFITSCATALPEDPDITEDTVSGTEVYSDSEIETAPDMDSEDTSTSSSDDIDTTEEGTDDDTDTDECPLDDQKERPGICGCGIADIDSDADSVPDCYDNCPKDPEKTEPGFCGCGVAEGNCYTSVYEAEDRTAEQDVTLSSGNSGYLGTGYIDYGGAGAWIEWNDVSVPLTGTYTLEFRYSTSNYNRPCTLVINGVEYAEIPFNGTPGTSWSDWTVNEITAPLPSGISTIRVRSVGTGPNLDRMTITWHG